MGLPKGTKLPKVAVNCRVCGAEMLRSNYLTNPRCFACKRKAEYARRNCRCFPRAVDDSGYCGCCDYNHATKTQLDCKALVAAIVSLPDEEGKP